VAAPTELTAETGANTCPTDDATSIGGTPTVTLTDQTVRNQQFDETAASATVGTDLVHYNVLYRANREGAGGHAYDPVFFLVNGLRLVASAGVVSVEATAADAGKKLICYGFNSGALVTSVLTLLDGTAVGGETIAASNLWRCELVASDGVTPEQADGPITVYHAGTLAGQLEIGWEQLTAEYEYAFASAADEELAAPDRLTAPTATSPATVSSYSRPLRIGSLHTEVALPDLDDDQFIGIAIKKHLKGGLPAPKLGYVRTSHDAEFTASA